MVAQLIGQAGQEGLIHGILACKVPWMPPYSRPSWILSYHARVHTLAERTFDISPKLSVLSGDRFPFK